MKADIETLPQFIKSLNPQQHAYFIGREANNQKQLETCIRELGRGIIQVSALYGDAVAITLAASESNAQPSITNKRIRKISPNRACL